MALVLTGTKVWRRHPTTPQPESRWPTRSIKLTDPWSVPPSQSAELFDIKNRLDKADSIAENYGVDLDYREHSFIELCDIENRIRIAVAINQQYGKNIDWREYGYSQLVEMEQQLRSQSPQRAKRSEVKGNSDRFQRRV